MDPWKQLRTKFSNLMSLYRESSSDESLSTQPVNLPFVSKYTGLINERSLSKTAGKFIETLKTQTIRVLSEDEFNRILYHTPESQPKFYIPPEESFFPHDSVRKMVRNNEFIQHPIAIYGSVEKASGVPSIRKTEKRKQLSLLEGRGEDFLQVKPPHYLTSKAKIFEARPPVEEIQREYCLERQRGCLPNHFVPPIQAAKKEDFVLRHSQGFKNQGNKDFFEHVFRLLIKNKAVFEYFKKKRLVKGLINSPDEKSTTFLLNSPYYTKPSDGLDFNLLRIREMVIAKSLIDLKTYEEIINIYHRQQLDTRHSSLPELASNPKNLNVVSLSPEYLKVPNQQKFLHEEVFIMNILEKAQFSGLRSLSQSEISVFQAIVAKRKTRIESMKREILELAEPKDRNSQKRFATLINATADTEHSSHNPELSEPSEGNLAMKKHQQWNKRTLSTGNDPSEKKIVFSEPKSLSSEVSDFLKLITEAKENNIEDVIHRRKGKTMLSRREKLRPLTMVLGEGEGSNSKLFGNVELEEVNYRLEAAKAQLFARLDLGHLKQEMGKIELYLREQPVRDDEESEDFKEVLEETFKKTDEIKPVSPSVVTVRKTNDALRSFFDFSGIKGKLQTKSVNLEETLERSSLRPAEIIEEKLKNSSFVPDEVISEESAKDSGKGSRRTTNSQMSSFKRTVFARANQQTNPKLDKSPFNSPKQIARSIGVRPEESDEDPRKDIQKEDLAEEVRGKMQEKCLLILENLKKPTENENNIEEKLAVKTMKNRESIKSLQNFENMLEMPKVIIKDMPKSSFSLPKDHHQLEKPQIQTNLTLKVEKGSSIHQKNSPLQTTPIDQTEPENPVLSSAKEVNDLEPEGKRASKEALAPKLTTTEKPRKKALKSLMRSSQIVVRLAAPIKLKKARNSHLTEDQRMYEASKLEKFDAKSPGLNLQNDLNPNNTLRILINSQTVLTQKLDQLKQPFTVKATDDDPQASEDQPDPENASKKPSSNPLKPKPKMSIKAGAQRKSRKTKGSSPQLPEDEIKEDRLQDSPETLLKRSSIEVGNGNLQRKEDTVVSMAEEDLDKLLLQDMASLEKKALRLQQYKNKGSLPSMGLDALVSPKSQVILPEERRRSESLKKEWPESMKKDSLDLEREARPINSKLPSRRPSLPSLDQNLSLSSEERLRNELSLLEGPAQNQPLRLSVLTEIPGQAKFTQKNSTPFWEEQSPASNKQPSSFLNLSNPPPPSKPLPTTLLRSSVASNWKAGSPMTSPSHTLLRVTLEKTKTKESVDFQTPGDLLKLEQEKADDRFFLNATPYLRKNTKRPDKEGENNPYSKLKDAGEEQFYRKKTGQELPSRNQLKSESQNTSFSDDFDLKELIEYELRKSQNFKLGDLKHGIEENITKMTEEYGGELDPEDQNRKEQLQRYLELANESHQSWLMQPDCLDQLKTFMSEKSRYFADYEKNASLKFSAPIQIPKVEGAGALNELSKNNLLLGSSSSPEQEKMLEYLMTINEETLNERDRKRRFRVEKAMLRVIREFVMGLRSRVKQGTLREQGELNLYERKAALHPGKKMSQRKKRQSEKSSEGIGSQGAEMESSKKMGSLVGKLRELKEKNNRKFSQIIEKCDKIRKSQLAYY